MCHEVCPLAGVEVYAALARRGYRPVELSSVLYQPIDADHSHSRPIRRVTVRRLEQAEAGIYGKVRHRDGANSPRLMPYIEGFARLSVVCATCFVAEHDGAPIATAALFMHEGTALLAGASRFPPTAPGAQNALLNTRLHTAASNGCDLAMMVAAPGSSSQRNAERQGFRIAYTLTKWQC